MTMKMGGFSDDLSFPTGKLCTAKGEPVRLRAGMRFTYVASNQQVFVDGGYRSPGQLSWREQNMTRKSIPITNSSDPQQHALQIILLLAGISGFDIKRLQAGPTIWIYEVVKPPKKKKAKTVESAVE